LEPAVDSFEGHPLPAIQAYLSAFFRPFVADEPTNRLPQPATACSLIGQSRLRSRLKSLLA
ncbi:MAG: hypothetical protein KDI62_30140, partial [Anaerolineae bacterium]|nr:hypothetical protein [Anaerolineae bacterium]